MIVDGIPLVGLSAPALLAIAILMLFTGRIATRRELNGKDEEIRYLRDTLATKDQTIDDFKESIAASNALIEAVLSVARERQ